MEGEELAGVQVEHRPLVPPLHYHYHHIIIIITAIMMMMMMIFIAPYHLISNPHTGMLL